MAKILIVDDDPIIREMLTLALQAGGHQVQSAVDAYSAAPLAVKFKPDLITLDFEMPAGNGFTVLARLRNITETAKTPVIFISGSAGFDRNQSPHKEPNIRFLFKPVNVAKLAACVAELLKNASAPGKPPSAESDGAMPRGDILDLDV